MVYETLRCPACGAIEWERNGFWVRELGDGAILRQRMTPPRDGVPGPWTCTSCGHLVPVWGALHAQINAAQAGAESGQDE